MRTRTLACVLSLALVVLFGSGFALGSRAAKPTIAGSLICLHSTSSEWFCADTTRNTMVPLANVRGSTLEVTYKDGTNERFEIPSNTDAIFLTKSSVTKVLRGYYKSTKQKAKIAALDKRMKQVQ